VRKSEEEEGGVAYAVSVLVNDGIGTWSRSCLLLASNYSLAQRQSARRPDGWMYVVEVANERGSLST
jgi:hypothetical protein